MCRWCNNSQIFHRLTEGLTAEAPTRRQFMSYAVSTGAAVAGLTTSRRAWAAGGADVIFRNGVILPMAGAQRSVEALAIGGGKILAAGSAADVSGLTGATTRIVDLQGRTALPGLIDPHHHTVLCALIAELTIDVGYLKFPGRADVIAALKAAAQTTPPGQWIKAAKFDNLLQGGDLQMSDLDAISTEHPIFVWYVNGHEAAANGMALQTAKIPPDIGDLPAGGRFGRGPDGKLNGLIFEESAVLRVLSVALPPLSPELMAKAVTTYTRQVAALGNTTLHEPGTIKAEWVAGLAKLSNEIDIRLSAALSSDEIEAGKAFTSLGPGATARRIPDSRFSLYGIKFWADGSNQIETAAQSEPYLRSALKGNANYSVAQMADICRAAKAADWPIMVHCHGDEAIEDVLDAIEQGYGAHPSTGLNLLQHATMTRQDQIERMKRLGVEPSLHPNLLNFYGAAYRDEIFGPERAAFAVPAGACVKAGVAFSAHTDGPTSPMGSLRLAQVLVTRRCSIDHSVIGRDQAVAIDDALRAITINAARHIGLSEAIGTLEAGKEADLTILESDPYQTDPEKLSTIKVSETWVAGEKKFG